MPIYSCDGCDYKTRHKPSFEKHKNKKTPCKKNTLHGNAKKELDTFICTECEQILQSKSALKTHNDRFHANKNEGIIANKTGNINKIVNNSNNNNTNITNNIHIHPVIHNYKYFDINDMSLFEQYLALTSDVSPYVGILDNLNLNPNKPRYHNMKITNKRDKYMSVHNGNDWINEFKNKALTNIISSEGDTFKKLYYKFRLFLKDDYLQNYKQQHDPEPATKLFRQIQESIHLSLYNNTKSNRRKEIIIPDKDDPIWRPLDKNFTWAEVESILTKLDELGIHFSVVKKDKVEDIKPRFIADLVNVATKKDPGLKAIFRKFLKQIKRILNNNGRNKNESMSTAETESSTEVEPEEKKKYTSDTSSIEMDSVGSDSEENPNDHISKNCHVKKKKIIPKEHKNTSETDSDEINSEELLRDHISKYCCVEKTDDKSKKKIKSERKKKSEHDSSDSSDSSEEKKKSIPKKYIQKNKKHNSESSYD